MSRIRVILLSVFLFFNAVVFSQPKRIVLKFKQNTPIIVLDAFTSNNIRNSQNPISKSIEKFNVNSSEQLFNKFISKLNLKNNDAYGIDRIFILNVSTNKIADLISEIKQNEFVEYVKEVSPFKLESFTPNDPYYANQYYLNRINIPQVWDSQQGGDAVVGIIDSGLDFLHPDLQQSYFINTGEFGNGKETNGIDDDNDGFVDNWRGWNFVDNNNNPTDDNIFSHGTCVAGIVSAGFNNGIGISSVTGGTKSLIMRCFNSQGIGYEDQIATAILYGVMQGVKVFNFSFGDYIYSELLRDVVKYAYSKNVTIVCSAGNDNSSVLHYPSSFEEVISVAASDELDRKATFSAYGVTVDLFAPGVNILTTSRVGQGSQEYGNNYMLANGTSFSAPIVAGIASILKAKNPNLTNEEIRGILVSSTNYLIGQNNWDDYFSAGIANAYNSFQNYNNPTSVRFFSPQLNYSFINDTVAVSITAASAFFTSYSLKYGVGLLPSGYTELFSSPSQVIKDTVFKWKTNLFADTTYTLKLIVSLNNGRTVEHSAVIHKNKSSPVFTNYSNGEIIFNDGYSEFITFTTKEPTKGLLYYKRKNVNEDYKRIFADDGNVGYFTESHFALLNHFSLQPNTDYEYYFEAISMNGKSTIKNDTSFYFTTKNQIDKYSFVKKSYNLPKSQIFDKVVDVFNNGGKNLFTNNVSLGLTAELYSFSNNKFDKINSGWIGNNVVRDIINRSTKWELLTSQQRTGSIFESQGSYQIPSSRIWTSGNSDEFWSSKFADVDGDGVEEILGYGTQALRILKFQGGVTDFAALNYLPANANNYSNSQNVIVNDFDNDGKTEIVFTNSFIDAGNNQNTSVNIYEHTTGSNFVLVFHEEYPLVIKGDNINTGDIDGDGKKEIVIGFSTDFAIPVKLFSALFIKCTANNTFEEYSSVEFYNKDAQAEISSKTGNVDSDSKDELIVNAGKQLYILKYNSASTKFEPIYFKEEINSYNSIVYDFDNNGIKELGINNSDSLIFLERNISFAGPSTPAGLKGISIDSNLVSLSFQTVAGAQYYKIYRGGSDTTAYTLLDSTTGANYSDTQISNRRDYYYKVSAVDTTKAIRESLLSSSVKVFVHNKSKLQTALYDKGLLTLKFSEKVSLQIPDLKSFVINGGINPSSVGIKSSNELSLSFKENLPQGNGKVSIRNLTDFYTSPVDTSTLQFSVSNADSASFYVTTLKLVSSNQLSIEFNTNVDTVTSYNLSNYTIEPFNLKVISAVRDNTNKKVLLLSINSSGNIGSSGRTYFIRINNVYSESGVKIVTGSGSVFSLNFVKEDLSSIAVYPNPYSKSKSSREIITFANLTKTAKVYVFTLSGTPVIELTETDGNGGVEWNLRDSKGNEVPSGIYIYKVEGKNSAGVEVESNMSKFAVVK